ncbi:hypothetical protein [Peribacillus sp. SCS-37]|uniref:hypothetical protein n=1 Tax=Paraperibacillus esterisolvens TaxID=3115296 RepID=UPI003905F771
MTFRVRILKGIRFPKTYAWGLRESEGIAGLWSRVAAVILASTLLFGIGGLFGAGSESLSGRIASLSETEFEAVRLFFLAGQLLSGILYAVILLFFFGLFIYILFDIEYKKVLVVQLFAVVIGLAGKAVSILLAVTAGLGTSASPLSLGVIGHYLTDFEPLQNFLGQISFFQAAVIAFQLYFYQSLSEKKRGWILLILILLHLLFWVIQAILLSINLGKFL